jgi:hypothetical protein
MIYHHCSSIRWSINALLLLLFLLLKFLSILNFVVFLYLNFSHSFQQRSLLFIFLSLNLSLFILLSTFVSSSFILLTSSHENHDQTDCEMTAEVRWTHPCWVVIRHENTQSTSPIGIMLCKTDSSQFVLRLLKPSAMLQKRSHYKTPNWDNNSRTRHAA